MRFDRVVSLDDIEVSVDMLTSSKAEVSFIQRVSRIASTFTFKLRDGEWVCLGTLPPDLMPIVSLTLSYCRSEWLRLDGDALLERYREIGKVVEYSEDYSKVRQTNAFAGPNWRK